MKHRNPDKKPSKIFDELNPITKEMRKVQHGLKDLEKGWKLLSEEIDNIPDDFDFDGNYENSDDDWIPEYPTEEEIIESFQGKLMDGNGNFGFQRIEESLK